MFSFGWGVSPTELNIVLPEWRMVHYSSHVDHYVLLAVDIVVHAVLYGTDVTVVSQPRALEAI